MPPRFAYDEVPYDTEANPEAHPRSMATLGRLFGLRTADPRTARVLEIGCGDGEHLIAAASYLPEARFVGFDLSAEAIARGVSAARVIGTPNVALFHRDVREMRSGASQGFLGEGEGDGDGFDYVVAHGVYSWVPESVRADVLASMRSALTPEGVGFLSVNALPGWELRRALRMLMREAAAPFTSAADRVRAALAIVDDLAHVEASGFAGVLAKAAAEYREHVARATPEGAPFSRYVFHDLLADCNDPFSVTELEARLRAAGLCIICETPLMRGRAGPTPTASTANATATGGVAWLAARQNESGSPFLQVLVCRADVASRPPAPWPLLEAVRAMHLWADLAPVAGGGFRTTTGALLTTVGDAGLSRAARAAPSFVPVRELADDAEALDALARDLFTASCEGVLTLACEPARIAGNTPRPRVAAHVRLRAEAAAAARARTAVLTSALHRSYRVPWAELVVVRELDGTRAEPELRARVARACAEESTTGLMPGALAYGDERAIALHVETVLDRFARHAFFVNVEGP